MMRSRLFMLVGLVVLAAVASAQPGDDELEQYAEPIVEDIGALPCCETDNGQCLPPEWQCVRATLDSDLGICSSLYGHITEVNWSAVATADRISQYFCGVDPSLLGKSVEDLLGYDLARLEAATEPEALPDLVVQSPSVSDTSPDSGAFFTLRATVRNQGDARSAVTTLRYYLSSNLAVSASTRVGTDVVGALSPGGTSSESVSLRAPSSAGTYYYGACVDAVPGESDTVNNCSSGVRVTVSSSSSGGGGGGVAGGACTAGLVVNPGGSCTYKGYTFTVSSSGRGSIAFFNAGTAIDTRGSTINGVLWNFHASKNSGSNSWTIHVAS